MFDPNYINCSGCGRIFSKATEREQFDAHPCAPKGSYEGWANRATWNVWRWLNNDYALYQGMSDYIKDCYKRNVSPSYRKLVEQLGVADRRTPDGFQFISKHLSFRELNRAVAEELAEYKKYRG